MPVPFLLCLCLNAHIFKQLKSEENVGMKDKILIIRKILHSLYTHGVILLSWIRYLL